MLILKVSPGDSVKIGDKVTVTVLAVKGDQVRFDIAAPQNTAVRCEVPSGDGGSAHTSLNGRLQHPSEETRVPAGLRRAAAHRKRPSRRRRS